MLTTHSFPFSNIRLFAMIVIASLINFAHVNAQKLSVGLGAEVSLRNPIITLDLPVSIGARPVSLRPFLRIGTQDAGILDHFQLGLGYSRQSFSIKGDFNFRDNYYDESFSGDALFKVGLSQIDIEGLFYLLNGNTRPYLKIGMSLFVPHIKSEGQLSADGDRVDWNLDRDTQNIVKSIFGANRKILGLGAEHRFNEHLALTIDWSFPITTLKSEIDIDEAIRELDKVLADFDQDPFDTDIEGQGNVNFNFGNSKSAVGILLYF